MKPSIFLAGMLSVMMLTLASCGEDSPDLLNQTPDVSGNTEKAWGQVLLREVDPYEPCGGWCEIVPEGEDGNNGGPFVPDKFGGVKILLEKTDKSGSFSTTTAPDGRWDLTGVAPEGMYNVTFEKDGYVPRTVKSWQFDGSVQTDVNKQLSVELCTAPLTTMGAMRVSHDRGEDKVLFDVEATPVLGCYVVFFGDSPDVSHRSGTYRHYVYTPAGFISLAHFAPSFEPGDNIYTVAYPVSECDLPSRFDQNGKNPAEYKEYFDLLEGQRSDVVHFVY